MSLMKWFNKPKWQSPNEKVRMTAVQNSQDQDLLEQLHNLVLNDHSPKVQKAALNRITDPEQLLAIAQQHPDKSIKSLANKKIINWFQSNQVAEQVSLFKRIEDISTIQALAAQAQNPSIRLNAINRITQQGLLGDLLLNESNEEVQEAILSRLDQASTLKRLLKKAGKKNLALKALIENKLNQGQSNSHEDLAASLCQQLESVVHQKHDDIDLTDIEQQWHAIRKELSDTWQQRFQGAFEAARMMLDPQHREAFLKQQKQQRALTELQQLEQILNLDTDLSGIQDRIKQFQDLDESLLDEVNQKRYEQAFSQLLAQRDEIQKAQKIPAKATDLIDRIHKALSQPTVQPQALQQFKSQWQKAIRGTQNSPDLATLTAQFNELCLKLAEKIENTAAIRDQAAHSAVELVDKAISEIKEGHLAQAKVITNQIAEHKRTAGFSHPVIKKNKYALDQVWTRLKELRNWQKWSNDQVRRDIINEVAGMHGQAIHPDAVLKKLKECNERWYALENMEKLEGDKFPTRNQALWQEFRTVSKAVFEPTQPFFEARSDQQNQRLDQINQMILDIQNMNLEESSERDLARASRNAIKHLKALDRLPPKQRGETAKKLRQAIGRIDERLNQFYQVAENKKSKLIAQAQALADEPDLAEAINTAKALQQQWKKAGIVKQHTERKLWKKFRQANDKVFKRRDDEKNQQDQAEKHFRDQIKQFITEQSKALKQLSTADELKQFKQSLQAGWAALENDGQWLKHELVNLLNQADEKLSDEKRKILSALWNRKQKLDELLTQREIGQCDDDQFESLWSADADEDLNRFFKKRLKNTSPEVDLPGLMIEAEFLTGMETPEAEMEQRMAYQVKVLSDRMAGGKHEPDHLKAQHLLDQWFQSPKNDAGFIKKNKKRIEKLLKALQNVTVS